MWTIVSRGVTAMALAAVLLASAGLARADGDPAAGRKKAVQCVACHGLDGLSKMPLAPNIAGSPAMYLEKQLKAFREGTRSEPNMDVVAKPLSDTDIADLAAWYSAIEVEATPPSR
jgi:cytochrome c553